LGDHQGHHWNEYGHESQNEGWVENGYAGGFEVRRIRNRPIGQIEAAAVIDCVDGNVDPQELRIGLREGLGRTEA